MDGNVSVRLESMVDGRLDVPSDDLVSDTFGTFFTTGATYGGRLCVRSGAELPAISLAVLSIGFHFGRCGATYGSRSCVRSGAELILIAPRDLSIGSHRGGWFDGVLLTECGEDREGALRLAELIDDGVVMVGAEYGPTGFHGLGCMGTPGMVHELFMVDTLGASDVGVTGVGVTDVGVSCVGGANGYAWGAYCACA